MNVRVWRGREIAYEGNSTEEIDIKCRAPLLRRAICDACYWRERTMVDNDSIYGRKGFQG